MRKSPLWTLRFSDGQTEFRSMSDTISVGAVISERGRSWIVGSLVDHTANLHEILDEDDSSRGIEDSP